MIRKKPNSYKYFIEFYGDNSVFRNKYLNNISEQEFINAWLDYINEFSTNKNFEQDIYENDLLDSYIRRKIKDIILKNR